jgi:Raf kinase inhibitor-like YbhB/YbcL family protein
MRKRAGGLWLWTVFDIPASAKTLPRGAGDVESGIAPAGSVQGATDLATYGKGYLGPCSFLGFEGQRYTFTVYALKVAKLGLDETAPGALVSLVARQNALASASIAVTYGVPGMPPGHPPPPTRPGFTLSSADIPDGRIQAAQVSNQLGCTGGNLSPQLSWRGAPIATESFVVTMYDLDAPTGSGFWHWAVFDIPGTQTSLPTGAGSGGGVLPEFAKQATSDYGKVGYGGPCPPAGSPPHRYQFTVYALDLPNLSPTQSSPFPGDATSALVGFYVRERAIAQVSFTATYGR